MFEYITAEKVEHSLKAMAILDIIIIPKKAHFLRTVQFNKDTECRRAVVDNGAGDSLIALFSDSCTLIKGFDHESDFNQFAADEWDSSFFERVYSGSPEKLKALLTEDDIDNTTFCMWCCDASAVWLQNEEPDNNDPDNDGGRDFLLGYVHQKAESWCDWAKYYYEREFDTTVVEKIYSSERITAEDINKINPKCSTDEALAEIAEIL